MPGTLPVLLLSYHAFANLRVSSVDHRIAMSDEDRSFVLIEGSHVRVGRHSWDGSRWHEASPLAPISKWKSSAGSASVAEVGKRFRFRATGMPTLTLDTAPNRVRGRGRVWIVDAGDSTWFGDRVWRKYARRSIVPWDGGWGLVSYVAGAKLAEKTIVNRLGGRKRLTLTGDWDVSSVSDGIVRGIRNVNGHFGEPFGWANGRRVEDDGAHWEGAFEVGRYDVDWIDIRR